ncbi:terminase small subunit [Paenibacillus thiaminolyticus]|uniref:terminase small subunit n=1 Tax=Paenibacillus thiaminolyticus TaxID=49283 RepID=UPI003D27ABF9
MTLTAKQKAFVQEYLIDLNTTQAADGACGVLFAADTNCVLHITRMPTLQPFRFPNQGGRKGVIYVGDFFRNYKSFFR